MTNAQGEVLYQMYSALYWQVWKIMTLFRPFLLFMLLKNISSWNVMWLYVLMCDFTSNRGRIRKRPPNFHPFACVQIWVWTDILRVNVTKNVISWQCSWVSSLQGKLEPAGHVVLRSKTSYPVIHDVAESCVLLTTCSTTDWTNRQPQESQLNGMMCLIRAKTLCCTEWKTIIKKNYASKPENKSDTSILDPMKQYSYLASWNKSTSCLSSFLNNKI